MANRIEERSFKPTGSVDTELLIQQIVWACSEPSDNKADVGKRRARCNRTGEAVRHGLGRAQSLVPQPAANALWLADSENRPKVISGKQALPQALKGQTPRTVFQPVDGTNTAAPIGEISALSPHRILTALLSTEAILPGFPEPDVTFAALPALAHGVFPAGKFQPAAKDQIVP